ncbi:hypothetical protein BP6252_03251 [Coleophoma cylindrospora]|uniref:Uncharacterized protein n=1 Tax=Coleophoma cylindrospora TaxID=1849047 RepID=A0A3D8S783_9HELO|nr:hypothetical protein BP6252_03251 [Coleophoma cylindrospora]
MRASTVQETPHARQDRTDALPRQPHGQADVRIPAQHRAGSQDRQGPVRQRGHVVTAVAGGDAWVAADRVPGGVHGGQSRGDGSLARRGEQAGCGCAVLGGHASL